MIHNSVSAIARGDTSNKRGRVFSKEIPKKFRAPAARDQFHSYQRFLENQMNSGVDSGGGSFLPGMPDCKVISSFFAKETIVQQRYRR